MTREAAVKKLYWLVAMIVLAMTADHAGAFPRPERSGFSGNTPQIIRVQGFQFEFGMSDGLIRQSLAREGYSDIKITKRKLTKARAEACKKKKRYVVEVKFDGDVRQVKQIGSCRSTVNAERARKGLKAKGFRKIQLLPYGKGFVAAACRDNRRFRLSLNEYGDIRRKTVLGRCGTTLSQYDVAALLRAQGYSRIRVQPARKGNYSVEACRQDNQVKLLVSNFGVVVREKPAGRCEPPIHPAIIPAVLARYGFTRIDIIDRTLPRYVAHACRDTQRVAISMNRYGEIIDEEPIGRCEAALTADGLTNMLRRAGYDRVRNVRDTASGYAAEVCEDGFRLELELTRYGETIGQRTLGDCPSRRVRRVLDAIEKDGVRDASMYVDGCLNRSRIRIEIDRFGNVGSHKVIGTCR